MAFTGEFLLWHVPRGLCCSLVRREWGPRLEVTISRGPEVIRRIAFRSEEEALAFVIAAAEGAMAEMNAAGPLAAADPLL